MHEHHSTQTQSRLGLMQGFIAVNKCPGPSSFRVVQTIRRLSKEKRVGHAGTLDPFASGLLIIAIGRQFTRQIDTLQNMPKFYRVKAILGHETDTLDSYGNVTKSKPVPNLSQNELDAVLSSFVGEMAQLPPQFSAKKVKGIPAYKHARKGTYTALQPKRIVISKISLIKHGFPEHPMLVLDVACSKGTYIRSLIKDIAEKLGTVGYCKDLCRTGIGPYHVDKAIRQNALSEATIQEGLFRQV